MLRSILTLTSSEQFAALPVWLEFALSALSISAFQYFSISVFQFFPAHPPFPRSPIFATSFDMATALSKATTGRAVRRNGSIWGLPQKACSQQQAPLAEYSKRNLFNSMISWPSGRVSANSLSVSAEANSKRSYTATGTSMLGFKSLAILDILRSA